MDPVVCGGCGELLDRNGSFCRLCGESNRLDDTPVDKIEVSSDLELQLDRLKPWSQIKHTIIDKYLSAYTTILRKNPNIKRYVYIDAFAGAGVAVDDATNELVDAGASRALDAEPPFSEYHFIEQNKDKADLLAKIARRRPDARVHLGDYREVLPRLLERCRYDQFGRGCACLIRTD